MSNFTRVVKTQAKVLKISCVRCHFVKFDIYFLGLSYSLVLLQIANYIPRLEKCKLRVLYTRHAWISIAISILYVLCISAHAQFCSHSHLPRGFRLTRLSARVSFDLDSRTTFVQTVRLFTSLRIQRKRGLKAEPPRALLNEPIHTLQIKITRFTDGFRLKKSVYTVFPRIVSFFASNGAIIWNFALARRLFEIMLRLASHALNILFVCLFFSI